MKSNRIEWIESPKWDAYCIQLAHVVRVGVEQNGSRAKLGSIAHPSPSPVSFAVPCQRAKLDSNEPRAWPWCNFWCRFRIFDQSWVKTPINVSFWLHVNGRSERWVSWLWNRRSFVIRLHYEDMDNSRPFFCKSWVFLQNTNFLPIWIWLPVFRANLFANSLLI